MTVAEVTDLRRQIRAAGASFKVTKNRLARLALKGTRFEGLGGLFTGPTAIAYSEDPVAAAKVVSDFANSNNKLVIVGGGIGENLLDEAGVKALARLPSLTELRGRIAGLLQAPRRRRVRARRGRWGSGLVRGETEANFDDARFQVESGVAGLPAAQHAFTSVGVPLDALR